MSALDGLYQEVILDHAKRRSGKGLAELLGLIGGFRELLRSRGTVEPDEAVLGDAAAFAGVSRFVARVKCAMLGWVAAEEALSRAVWVRAGTTV